MWDRSKLEALAQRRTAGLSRGEAALLAFARWQEMTDESDARPDKGKAEFERLVAAMGDEDTQQLASLGDFARDEVIREFQLKIFETRTAQMEAQRREIASLPDWKVDLSLKDQKKNQDVDHEALKPDLNDDDEDGHRRRRR